MNKEITIIAALSQNGIIGKNGTLPWKLKADLQNFKEVTKESSVIMGSTTFTSLGRPLPHRQNIVVTRTPEKLPANVTGAKTLQEARNLATNKKIFLLGGTRIFEEGLPIATQLILTNVKANIEGDTYFPLHALNLEDWQAINTTFHPANQNNDYPFEITTYQKKIFPPA